MMQERAIPCFWENSQTYKNINRQLKMQKQTITSIKSRKLLIQSTIGWKNTYIHTPYTIHKTREITKKKLAITLKKIRHTCLIAEEKSIFPPGQGKKIKVPQANTEERARESN